MAEAAQLDRPGVEIIQEFVGTTPTILRPNLQACIVGPCNQVVEAIGDDGLLNSDSLISVPARLTTPWMADPYQFAGLGGKTLVLSVNNGPSVPVVFPGTNPTAAQVVDAIRTAQIAGLTAKVESSEDQRRVVLQTTSKGDNAGLLVHPSTSADVLTAFGFTPGQTISGSSGYDNGRTLRIHAADYPDPRSNGSDLKIDYDSVRVFISSGGTSPREVRRDEALVQGATSDVSVFDDGDSDALSPYLDFVGANFAAAPTKARAEGTADISGIDYAATVQGKILRMSVNGEPYQALTFPNTVADSAALVAAINGLWGAGFASITSNHLVLSSQSAFGGRESSINIDKAASSGALLTALGLTGASAPFEGLGGVQGTPYKPQVGDEVWVDGLKLGAIVEVLASPTNRLRLENERLLTFEGTSWYIVAKQLNNSAASAQRPSSDLIVDANTGTLTIKAGLFHDTSGKAVVGKGLQTYLAYNALRLDVTPAKAAGDFNLLRIGQLSDLETKLAPVDTQNPLSLGMYFALLNAPGLEVAGCGVDETNDSAPEGTPDSYARAFEYLESKEVYGIAPLTHSGEVGSVGALHVTVMSEPANGLERKLILNPLRPSRKSSLLVASGPKANVSGAPSDIINTDVASLQPLLATAGKPGPVYTLEDGVYLELEGDPNHYLIESVSSSVISINNGPLDGNDDNFFFDGGGQPVFETMIVDRPFTIFVRGTALQNRTDEAVAYADIGRGYRNKRVLATVPDTFKATLDGLETAIPGYYAAAALAGRISAKGPSQPLTEDILAGFSGVVGSQERYSEIQLRIIDGGGMWVLYQSADGQPVRTRHQLTTDVSTLLARESSIVDALDFAAKVVRTTFKNFIGRYNITTSLIEALNLVCGGIRDYLLLNSVFSGFEVVELKQDVNAPDEIVVTVDITTLKPVNKIRVTFRVV